MAHFLRFHADWSRFCEAKSRLAQASSKKPGFPLQVLGFAYAKPAGFPLQSLARPRGFRV
jgi:hypothetical protein